MIAFFETTGVRAWVHARCLATGRQAGYRAGERVVLASVVKVPLVLEFARQVAAGQLDPTDRVRVTAGDRLGGTGTAGCSDDVELSLRDAAFLAMSLSDNSAADLLFDRVGVENVQALMTELGLTSTRVVCPPRDVVRSMAEEIGAGDPAEFAARFPLLTAEDVLATRALDAKHTNASTPEDMTRLLELVWTDKAGRPESCAAVRAWMAQQVNWLRLGAAFPPEVSVEGKTGTLPCVRNEIGVVTYPDGGRYAVAVFTRVASLEGRRPDIERAIGLTARAAVESLRER
ncbi:serine hydrolase [Saccharomonospora xinjiangensis]|uniref:Beta-lactamase class A n=1 Tax=Saccharomonospora xinjiangensis XJ-54 TaxID=882086 RepID=I0V623_9PSEU|nr:serine hydrolase [Saccharomonospora xinjiangensis]EID55576.1 beta-lactamase class A [Saccharomonospora xinjiangensis XJ-54]